jgi:hypothetical protein
MNTEHPLADDPTQLSFDELDKRINELTKRWYTARRMNMNQTVLHQLDMMLQGLEYEKQRRALQNTESTGVVIDTDGKIDKDS